MRFTTSLLSSAALLAMGTVGFAADLPSKKAAPVEYVRICSQFGAGFFYIPGSDTCLKVGGRVRADYNYTQPFKRTDNATSTLARGYVTLDAYTATDYGPLRATTRIYATKSSGSSASVTLDWAYIQFMGFTAGRITTSFFEFAPFGGISLIGGGGTLGRGSDYGAINTLAYTAAFGGGFSASLSLEDGTERRQAISGGISAGHSAPDVVGRLDYTGGWGQIALTGALHQIRSDGSTDLAAHTPVYDASISGDIKFKDGYKAPSGVFDTKYGFAIQGGVKLNLPMLAPGDALFLQAAYSEGASSYTGWGSGSAGTVTVGGQDAVIVNGKLELVKTYSVTGGLRHYFTPTIEGNVYAAYGSYNPPGAANNYKAFSVGTNVRWLPVSGFQVVPGVEYFQLTDTPAGVGVGTGQSKNHWAARLRVQRDF